MKAQLLLFSLLCPVLAQAGTHNDSEGQYLYSFLGAILVLIMLYKPALRLGSKLLAFVRSKIEGLKEKWKNKSMSEVSGKPQTMSL